MPEQYIAAMAKKSRPSHRGPRSARLTGQRATDDPLPLFCDFTCSHSAFAPPDASGACRREQAVYCALLCRFNNKNSRCAARNKDREER